MHEAKSGTFQEHRSQELFSGTQKCFFPQDCLQPGGVSCGSGRGNLLEASSAANTFLQSLPCLLQFFLLGFPAWWPQGCCGTQVQEGASKRHLTFMLSESSEIPAVQRLNCPAVFSVLPMLTAAPVGCSLWAAPGEGEETSRRNHCCLLLSKIELLTLGKQWLIFPRG